MVAAKTKTRGPVTPVDKSLVTADEHARLLKEAKAAIEAERHAAAEEAVRKEYMAQERAKFDPTEEMVQLTIDIPAFDNRILVDGVPHYHGEVVKVTRKAADSLREQMGRMWELEKTSGNPNLSQYKPVKEDSFSALSVGTGSFARV